MTLALDDDVAAVLARLRKARGNSLKALVNEALREGLKHMTSPPKKRKRFRTTPADLGRCLLGSVDNVADVLAVAEGDAYK
jgi:hypothetical protein